MQGRTVKINLETVKIRVGNENWMDISEKSFDCYIFHGARGWGRQTSLFNYLKGGHAPVSWNPAPRNAAR